MEPIYIKERFIYFLACLLFHVLKYFSHTSVSYWEMTRYVEAKPCYHRADMQVWLVVPDCCCSAVHSWEFCGIVVRAEDFANLKYRLSSICLTSQHLSQREMCWMRCCVILWVLLVKSYKLWGNLKASGCNFIFNFLKFILCFSKNHCVLAREQHTKTIMYHYNGEIKAVILLIPLLLYKQTISNIEGKRASFLKG